MTSGTISIDNVQRVHELSRRCDENARRVMRVTTKCLLKLLERVTERANPPGRSLQIGGAGAASGPEAQRSRSRISAAPPRPPPRGGGPPRETSNLSRALEPERLQLRLPAVEVVGRAKNCLNLRNDCMSLACVSDSMRNTGGWAVS